MHPSPEISILLCSYNRAPTLGKFFDVLREHHAYLKGLPFAFEVICVNDGSTDNTRDIFVEALRSFPGKYIEHPKNSALAAARNSAIRNASGKFLLFVNDDTYFTPNLLEEHLLVHDKHENVPIAVLGIAPFVPEHEKRILSQALIQCNLLFPWIGLKENIGYNFDHFVTANLSVARNAFLAHNIWFDETFRRYGCEDIEVGYRLWKKNYRVFFHPQAKVIHDHRLTVRDYQRREENNNANLVQYLDKHPELVPHYLEVPELSEEVLSRWQGFIEEQREQVTQLINQLEAVQEIEFDSSGEKHDMEVKRSVRHVGEVLMFIRNYTKVKVILDTLQEMPEVKRRLVGDRR